MPLVRMDFLTPEIEARFWTKVDKKGEDECWEWLCGKDEQCYGQFSINHSTNSRAHRIAYMLQTKKSILKEIFILHSCDNPSCVNPSHLREGTHAENMADVVARKRRAGEKNKHSKLTAEDVKAMREEYATGEISQRALASKYAVSQGTIGFILRGETWKHLT